MEPSKVTKTRNIDYYVFIHFTETTLRSIFMLGVFHLLEQIQSVKSGGEFRNMSGRTDGERLINGWWHWGDDKPTLITVTLVCMASEWRRIPYLICQSTVCQQCDKTLAKKCFVSVLK